MLNFAARRQTRVKRVKYKPAYDLVKAIALVGSGDVRFRRRARAFLENHYGTDLISTAKCVLESLEPSDFKECVELEYMPGTYADVYIGGTYDDIEWYVKFYIDEAGSQVVDIWSMVWDGTNH